MKRLAHSTLLMAWLLCATVQAARQVEDTLGKHVVQSGENLWSITAHYLGEDFLWRENWKLNPEIENPHMLRIGQVLTVITERRVTAENATVAQTSNQVDKNLQNSSWTPASPGDSLQSRDGIRTREASSASLQFNDATRMNLSEYSQVFLQSKQTDLRGVDRGRIEVRRGRVEMAFDPIARKPAEIELVVGPASARPDVGPDGSALMAAVADETDGGAAVMVYHGNSSVEAAGSSVSLKRGMGSRVPASGPPSAPERLLPRPRGLRPATGANWAVANPVLNWQAVDAASAYVVEVCLDADCNQLAQKSERLTETRWQPELTSVGDYHWRVRAISASGLEGYASRTAQAYLASTLIDREPPQVAVIPEGFVKFAEGRMLISPQTRLSLSAHDSGIGISWVRYRLGGDDWKPWENEPISLPADAFAWMEFQAADQLGNESEVVRIELISIQ